MFCAKKQSNYYSSDKLLLLSVVRSDILVGLPCNKDGHQLASNMLLEETGVKGYLRHECQDISGQYERQATQMLTHGMMDRRCMVGTLNYT